MTDDAFEAVIVRNGRRVVARQAVPGQSRAEAIAATVHLAELLAERDPDAAIQVYEQVLHAQRAERGPTHPETARTLEHLAHLLLQEGRLTEARDRLRELAAAVDSMFGPRHPETLGVLSDLASVLQWLGELRRASELYATVLPALLDVSGPDDQQTAVCANNYAVLLLRLGAHEEARSWFTAALPGLERHYGPTADILVSARSDLAECEAVTGRTEDPAEVRRWIEARRPPPSDRP